MPAIDMLSMKAKAGTAQASPNSPAMWLTACTIPCSTLMSLFTDGDQQSQSHTDVEHSRDHAAP